MSPEMLEFRGKLINQRVQIISHYKNGELGTIWFETEDKENGTPYVILKLDNSQRSEVFWYGEFMLAES
jgi:hypothetical protein